MGQDTLREVRDGSGHPPEALGWVGTPSGRSGAGRLTLREVRDTLQKVRNGLGHPKGGPARVGTPSGRSETGWDTLR